MRRRIKWWLPVTVAAAALFLGASWLLRPLSFEDLVSSPNPAQSYSEAMERWERKQSEEAKQPLHEGGRTIRLPRRDRQVQMSPRTVSAPRSAAEIVAAVPDRWVPHRTLRLNTATSLREKATSKDFSTAFIDSRLLPNRGKREE